MAYKNGSNALIASANSNPAHLLSRYPALFLALNSRYLRVIF
jgi:hypothetical protein